VGAQAAARNRWAALAGVADVLLADDALVSAGHDGGLVRARTAGF
jgi:hypothetical protein